MEQATRTLPVIVPRLDLPAPDVSEAVAMAALLGDRSRAAILRMLRDGPHCVCELAAALGERENNVSNHLARLRDAGLVRASRHEANARFLYYVRDEDAVARAREDRRDPAVTIVAVRPERLPFWTIAGLGSLAWLVAWFVNLPAADWFAYEALGLERGSQLGDAVAFFVYDLPKVLLLLTGIVTVVSFLRSFVSAERVRRALAGRGVLPGTAAAAGFGVVTPFCSCSAVPLFIGFVEAGVPLGVTFAFLVASPMVNEVALVLLWGLFGPGVALAYMGAGLAVAIGAGLIIGRLRLERYVEDYVWQIRAGAGLDEIRPTLELRVRDAWRSTRDIVRRVFPFVVAGIGVGALIHGFVPTDLVVAVGGRDNPLAVPAVVALGVPLYSNAAGTIPVVEALIGKGLPLGSALAFMMAVTALSIPELVILRRVMKPRLIAVFVAVVAGGILAVGYGFNALVS